MNTHRLRQIAAIIDKVANCQPMGERERQLAAECAVWLREELAEDGDDVTQWEHALRGVDIANSKAFSIGERLQGGL
jgi:hypothetical protein